MAYKLFFIAIFYFLGKRS